MKVGDLVRMKYECYVRMRQMHPQLTSEIGLVYSTAGRGIKVYMANGEIKVGLMNQWEVV